MPDSPSFLDARNTAREIYDPLHRAWSVVSVLAHCDPNDTEAWQKQAEVVTETIETIQLLRDKLDAQIEHALADANEVLAGPRLNAKAER